MTSLLDDLRRPEHTGENRCWSCTTLNVALLAVVVVVLAARRRRGTALLVGLVGVAGIALRGYLVPGTPRFAPRLVAASPLPEEWFHDATPVGVQHRPARGDEAATADPKTGTVAAPDDPDVPDASDASDAPNAPNATDAPDASDAPDSLADLDDAPEGEDLLGALVDAGVLQLDGDVVVPAPAFRADWDAATVDLRDLDTGSLADAVFEAAHAAEGRAEVGEGEWVVLSDGSGEFAGETWLPRPVAIAEAGAWRALDGYDLDEATRLAATGPLRMFLDECPDCGTTLEETDSLSCCGGTGSVYEEPDDVLACPACGVRLFTFDEEG